jgi:hypothetical protein
MSKAKWIGSQLIVIALLCGVGYYYASANPLKLYAGRTIEEWKQVGDEVTIERPGRIQVIEGYSGSIYYLHEEFNTGLLKNIIIYGLCVDLLLLGGYLMIYNRKKQIAPA